MSHLQLLGFGLLGLFCRLWAERLCSDWIQSKMFHLGIARLDLAGSLALGKLDFFVLVEELGGMIGAIARYAIQLLLLTTALKGFCILALQSLTIWLWQIDEKKNGCRS